VASSFAPPPPGTRENEDPQPAPALHPPLPPTSTEFAHRVLADRNLP
jgi:hypothetical protein